MGEAAGRALTPPSAAVLPILEHRAAIEGALRENQVLIVRGETGSGKTTQIPQICLNAGRGAKGRMIAVTQPRRLAATTVAERVARELGADRNWVGWKHRFAKKTSRDNRILFLTDGVLLAEMRSDPLLLAYDTVMVDEAHERSLNVDFLLGSLKRILPRRPDLRVIVSSATLETGVFGDYFGGAPVLEIPGRTYPVEVRWRPPPGEEPDLAAAVADAVEECLTGPYDGDILVFLPGERDIRAAAEAVRGRGFPGVEALPLLASLPPAEQRRAFETEPGVTRVVLATNVAETSVTIPGVRYVVDSGLARIARHNPRAGVRRLKVEPVSQASAEQRKGRCGRTGPGVCIRLYDEEDFARRPAQTDPEIRRCSLAGTILSMLATRIGDIDDFPFPQPPPTAAVRDGWKRLLALGAVTEEHRITALGRRLARLPVEPEHARMLFEAAERGVLPEALVIVSALSCEDPLLRPQENAEKARQAHSKYRDKTSDFAGILLLWREFHDPAHPLSRSAGRRLAADSFLSWRRLCEWEDVRDELAAIVAHELPGGAAGKDPGAATGEITAERSALCTEALLSGLLHNIGRYDAEAREYRGAGGIRFSLFPGSGLAKAKNPPEWIVCAELVETTRLWARRVAVIDPRSLEPLARHLCRYSYAGEHWDARTGTARALRKAVLYGLTIQEGVPCDISRALPALCRELFIAEGLVGGAFPKPIPEFARRNLETIAAATDEARKTRASPVEETLAAFRAFYEERLPPQVVNVPTLRDWLRRAPPAAVAERLLLPRPRTASAADHAGFPDAVRACGLRLSLSYRHDPGAEDDGIACDVPPEALCLVPLLEPTRLVPGALRGKAAYLLRTLPRGPLGLLAARCGADPRLPDYEALADAVLAETSPEGPFLPAFTRALCFAFGVALPMDNWREEDLPAPWRILWRVTDTHGAVRFASRDTDEIAAFRDEYERVAPGSLPDADTLVRRHCGRTGAPRWLEKTAIGEVGARPLFAWGSLDPGGTATRWHSESAAAERAHRAALAALGPRLAHAQPPKPGTPAADAFARAAAEVFGGESATEAPPGPASRLPRAPDALAPYLRSRETRFRSLARDLASLADAVTALEDDLFDWMDATAALPEETVRDVAAQLGWLCPPGFAATTPSSRLADFPRYVEAARRRLSSAAFDPAADARRAAPVEKAWRRYADLVAHAASRPPFDETAAARYRWLVEEWRVAVFAQALGTTEAVSGPRIDAQWRRVVDAPAPFG